jgi:hypothetical protein
MTVTPLYNAIQVVRFAVIAALDPLVTPPVFWVRATQGVALPYVIAFSQDAGGNAVKTIGRMGWQGLVTVKALAPSLSAAEALLTAVVPGMASLALTGYTFVARYERPIAIPPTDDEWQCGHSWRVFINTA